MENIVFQSGLSPRMKSDDTDDDEDDIAPLLVLVAVVAMGDGVVVADTFVVSSLECGDDVMGWEVVADFSDCCRTVSCF